LAVYTAAVEEIRGQRTPLAIFRAEGLVDASGRVPGAATLVLGAGLYRVDDMAGEGAAIGREMEADP
jgi:hypothetical protein